MCLSVTYLEACEGLLVGTCAIESIVLRESLAYIQDFVICLYILQNWTTVK